MLPNSDQRKLAILDVINQLEISGHDKGRVYVYIKFKNEYPKLITRNRPEWESLLERMIIDDLIIENDKGCSVTEKGNNYYADLTRGTSASIKVEHSRNVQIGDYNVMSINYVVDSFKELEKKIQNDSSINPAQKESLISRIRNTIDNIEYLRKIPELAIYLSDLFSKVTG